MRPWPFVLAIAASCGFPSIDGEVVTQGRHITVHADPSLPICTESVEHADAVLEQAAALLHAPVPVVDFYVYAPGVDVCSAGNAAADCTSGTTVYSGRWPHDHELIHTVTGGFGRAPAFIQEGLAEALTSGVPIDADARKTAMPELDSVAFFAGDIAAHYRDAADFTRYLIERFGVDRYVALYRSLLFFDDAITTRQMFAHTMGESIDPVIADWQSAPAPDESLATFARCLGDPFPPTAPNVWSADEQADCVMSRSSTTLSQAKQHIFELEQPSVVSLRLIKPNAVSVYAQILSCTPTLSLGVGNGDVRRMELEVMQPGRKLFELFQEEDTVKDAPVQWTFTAHGPPATTCETATPVTVPAIAPYRAQMIGYPSTWPLVGDDHYELWLRFEGIATTEVNSQFFDQTGDSSAQICTGTCDAQTCVDGRLLIKQPITPREPIYVHLSAPLSSADRTLQFDLSY